MTPSIRVSLLGLMTALGLVVASCGTDDGAGVRDLGAASGDDTDSASASDSGSASASASAVAASDGEASGSTTGDGGYEYASNVDSHRQVVADICDIGGLLDSSDFTSVEAIYRDGVNSVKSDGSVRTIGGFAASGERSHGLATYYGTPTPLDEFVTAALDGTGMFEGASDAVRGQGVEKGIQNQTMVAWVVHELNSAVAKAEDGNFAVADGAVHDWDEGWAFFHGSQPGCGPYATGDKRAANFATVGAEGETALANEAILAAMISGRDALLAEDASGAKAAADDVLKNLIITYSQAAIRYAKLIEDDLAEGDAESAKVHQAEGLAFWRVIEAWVAPIGADFDTINAVYDLDKDPGVNGGGDVVGAALEPAWDALGITAADIGELQ